MSIRAFEGNEIPRISSLSSRLTGLLIEKLENFPPIKLIRTNRPSKTIKNYWKSSARTGVKVYGHLKGRTWKCRSWSRLGRENGLKIWCSSLNSKMKKRALERQAERLPGYPLQCGIRAILHTLRSIRQTCQIRHFCSNTPIGVTVVTRRIERPGESKKWFRLFAFSPALLQQHHS